MVSSATTFMQGRLNGSMMRISHVKMDRTWGQRHGWCDRQQNAQGDLPACACGPMAAVLESFVVLLQGRRALTGRSLSLSLSLSAPLLTVALQRRP